jgi:hypothetical protein
MLLLLLPPQLPPLAMPLLLPPLLLLAPVPLSQLLLSMFLVLLQICLWTHIHSGMTHNYLSLLL